MQKNAKSHFWKLTRKNAFVATAIVYFDVKLLALFPETFPCRMKKFGKYLIKNEGRKKKKIA